MRECMYSKAHDMLRKARKHKSGGHETILERWNYDDRYHKSLSDVGWTEEGVLSILRNCIGRLFQHCDERGKKSARELMETLI